MSGIKAAVKGILPEWVWKRLRKGRLAYEYWSYPHYQVERTYGRIRRKVEIHDGVAKDWYDRDWPELEEILFLEKAALRPGAKVFDLGAHHCVVAMMLADIVGPTGKVFALEPIPENVKSARRNLALNGVENCTVLEGAVTSESGWSQEFGRLYTIDELAQILGRPDLVFVDVEGFEWEALRGARKTLAADCAWMIEIHQGAGLEDAGSSASEIIDFFESLQHHQLYMGALEAKLEPLDRGHLPAGRFMMAALA